jgi:PTH1 family peptidyl-tRNA hydrolase
MFSFHSQKIETGSVEYIIAGLGNPGTQYSNSRHNTGFIVIDQIAEKSGIEIKRVKFKGLTGTGMIGNHKVLLLKPSTYMNLSGQSVTEAMNFYHLQPSHTIIIFDDISLDIGKMRIRRSGSDGGHNGIKNIIYLSGSDQFPRIKIGEGNKPNPNYDLANWVLSKYNENELKTIKQVADRAFSAVELIMDNEIEKAMNLYN